MIPGSGWYLRRDTSRKQQVTITFPAFNDTAEVQLVVDYVYTQGPESLTTSEPSNAGFTDRLVFLIPVELLDGNVVRDGCYIVDAANDRWIVQSVSFAAFKMECRAVCAKQQGAEV